MESAYMKSTNEALSCCRMRPSGHALKKIRKGNEMDTKNSFFNYPRATIERRKLVRQLRRIHLQPDGAIVPAHTGSCDMATNIAALEQELARIEMEDRHVGELRLAA